MTNEITTTPVTLMIPFHTIAQVIEKFIRVAGYVDQDVTIHKMYIPIQANEENLIEITLGVIYPGGLN